MMRHSKSSVKELRFAILNIRNSINFAYVALHNIMLV